MIHTARQNPKFLELVHRLRPHVGVGLVIDAESVATAILERLWHATATGAQRGDIGRFSNGVIAEMCGWLGDADALISILVDTHWIDKSVEHRLLIHDWHEHAPKFVKGVLGKKKLRFFTEPKEATLGSQPRVSNSGDDTKGCQPPNLTQPNQTTPPNPQGNLGGELLERGVTAPTGPLTRAFANGCTESHVRAVIAHFDAHRGAWSGFALRERVFALTPDQDPTGMWPPKSAEYVERQRRESGVAEQATKRLTGKQQLEQQRAREAELEREYGPIVDCMRREDAEVIIRRELGDSANPLLARWQRGSPLEGNARDALIFALEREDKELATQTTPT